jgi:hypothetical protein
MTGRKNADPSGLRARGIGIWENKAIESSGLPAMT